MTRRAWALAAVLLAACTGPQARTKKTMAELLAAGDYAAAAREVESRKDEYGPSNSALYHLDLGLALHYAGRHLESAQSFEAAERRLDELYTKSVAAAAGRLLANENIKDYRGQPSDRALGQFFDALNYVFLGRPEEALVAVRRLEAYLDELGRASAGARSYTDDALARYLAALLYRETGKDDDARISYEAARKAYARYPSLYGTGVPALAPPAIPEGMGEIVFLHYNGPAPRKVSVAGAGAKTPEAASAAASAPSSGLVGAAKRAAGATVKAATGVVSLAGDVAGAAAGEHPASGVRPGSFPDRGLGTRDLRGQRPDRTLLGHLRHPRPGPARRPGDAEGALGAAGDAQAGRAGRDRRRRLGLGVLGRAQLVGPSGADTPGARRAPARGLSPERPLPRRGRSRVPGPRPRRGPRRGRAARLDLGPHEPVTWPFRRNDRIPPR